MILVGITSLNVFTNFNLSNEFALLYESIINTFSWIPIFSIICFSLFIILLVVGLIKYDKKINGK